MKNSNTKSHAKDDEEPRGSGKEPDSSGLQPQHGLMKPQKQRSLYPVMFFIIIFLMSLELPYRSIHLHETVIIGAGIMSMFVIAFLAFENFFLVMLIMVCYIPFSAILPGDFGGFLTAFNLTNILTIVIVVGWVARGSFRGEKIYQFNKVDALLMAFCVLASLSMIQSAINSDLNEHITFTLKRYLTPFFLYFIYCNNVRNKKEIEYIYVATAFTTFVAAVMALKESYMDIGSFGSYDKMRVEGITQQPNDLAAFFSYYTPFLLVPFLHNLKKYKYWPLVFMSFLCFWATTRTFSRGGIIAFGISVVVTLFITHRKSAIALTIITVLLFTKFSMLMPETVIGRFAGTYSKEVKSDLPEYMQKQNTEIINPNRLDKSAAQRLEIWKLAIPYIKDNLFFGIGYARFDRIIRADAHNGFILIATEMGLPALLIYLLIFCKLFKSAYRLYRYSKVPLLKYIGHAYMASILAVVVANQFGSRLNSQELSSLFWIMGGLVVLIERKMQEQDPDFPSAMPDRTPPRRISGHIEPVDLKKRSEESQIH